MIWTMNTKPCSPGLSTSKESFHGVPENPSAILYTEPCVAPVDFPTRKRKWSASTSTPEHRKPQERLSLAGEIAANAAAVKDTSMDQVHDAVQCTEATGVSKKYKTYNRNELNVLRIQIAMISDSDGDRPIHVAVAQENLKLVQKLCNLMLKAAISLDLTNYLRQTPLHLAVILGNAEMIHMLLKYGSSIVLRDRNGNSVIHLAVKSGANKAVLCLILSQPESQTILNSLDHEGYSALHYAVQKSNKVAVSCLRNAGAQMDIIDGKSGRSPLIHAILDQKDEMVSVLLECGACAEVVDYSGRTAFELALHSSNKNIVQLLEKHMFSFEIEMSSSEQSKNFCNSTVKRTKSERTSVTWTKKKRSKSNTDLAAT